MPTPVALVDAIDTAQAELEAAETEQTRAPDAKTIDPEPFETLPGTADHEEHLTLID